MEDNFKSLDKLNEEFEAYKSELLNIINAAKERFKNESALLQNQIEQNSIISKTTTSANAKRLSLKLLLEEFCLIIDAYTLHGISLMSEVVEVYPILLESLAYTKITDLYDNDGPKRTERIAQTSTSLKKFLSVFEEIKTSCYAGVQNRIEGMDKSLKSLQGSMFE